MMPTGGKRGTHPADPDRVREAVEHSSDQQGTRPPADEPRELRVVARRNELVLRRFQQHELDLMAADSLPQLLQALTAGTQSSFGLDAVSLSLADPEDDIRDALAWVGLRPADIPGLGLDPASRWPADAPCRPRLGPVSEAEHGTFFGPALPGLASAALLPMARGGQSRGVLALGSGDALRYQPHLGTDFLDHLSTVATVCLENALNKERLLVHGRTDPLTGLYNRRYMECRLAEEVARSHRHNQPLSCLFMDMDHFKQVNDRHGHAAGDAVLRAVAGRITHLLRASDVAVRYGGEEFAVLLPQTGVAAARALAERLRMDLAALEPEAPGGGPLHVTVSVGVAELRPDEGGDAMLQAADEALYRAKHGGRNRVEARA